jgi:hypothetical protein
VVKINQDDTARVYDAPSGRLAAELRENGSVIKLTRISPDSKFILTVNSLGTAHVYPEEMFLPVKELRKLARTRATRELTPVEQSKYLHELKSK